MKIRLNWALFLILMRKWFVCLFFFLFVFCFLFCLLPAQTLLKTSANLLKTTKQNKTKKNRTEQKKTKQNKTKNKTKQNKKQIDRKKIHNSQQQDIVHKCNKEYNQNAGKM